MITQYGFVWGDKDKLDDGVAVVERAATVKLRKGTYRSLVIRTQRQRLQIDITPSGLIKVVGPDKRPVTLPLVTA